MTALTRSRNTPSRLPGLWYGPVEALAAGFAGGICAYNAAGNIVNGQTALNLKPAGRINVDFSNAVNDYLPYGQIGLGPTMGAAGAFNVPFEPGIFGLSNSAAGADFVTRALLGDPVYMVDDNTVAANPNVLGAGANVRSVMGTLIDIDAAGVCWVHVGLIPTAY